MPQVVVIAGPNGAGKSTSAPALVTGIPFVNADEIAKQLSPQPGRDVNLQAGRLMREQLDDLERQRADFALETTLANRALAPRLNRLRSDGYQVRLVFFWLTSVELAIQRVADRVRRGGHDIPKDTIRRRYRAGVANFFGIYQALADTWQLMENGADIPLRLVAEKTQDRVQIHDDRLWQIVLQAVTP